MLVRRLSVTALAVMSVLVGGLLLGSSAASAAAPETPLVEVENVTATSVTFRGELNPGKTGSGWGQGSYEFLYRASGGECSGEARAPEAPGFTEGAGEEALPPVAVSGLAPGTEYAVCLLARNHGNETTLSAPVVFSTSAAPPTAPQVAGESVSDVLSVSAQVKAQVASLGEETYFYVQYGTSSCAVDPASCANAPALPGADVGAGKTAHAVGEELAGLTPGTVYHYRVVAVNGAGMTDGLDETFTTPTSAGQLPGSEQPRSCPNEQLRAEQPYGLGLPDCRAYEMVSPVNTEGQDATEAFSLEKARAAVSGEAVVYSSAGDFADAPGGDLADAFLSRRGAEGWSTRGITPLQEATKLNAADAYGASVFTPELTAGIASTEASLTGEATPGHIGLYVDDFANGSYTYLGETKGSGDGELDGASTDLSNVVFGDGGDPKAWADGKVVPVAVNNKGEELVSVNKSGEELPASIGSQSEGEHGQHEVWHAVSVDASRVYFTSPGFIFSPIEPHYPGPGVLYVRVNPEQPQSPMDGEECVVATDACTVDVSLSQRSVADPHGPQTVRFWGASTEGSRVFFTSRAELTEEAYTGPDDNAENLYEYELSGEAGKPGRLTDLTVDDAGDGAVVLGVVQISEDGSYVYFVAKGKLADGATAGEPNLYVSHDGGAPVFVATLAAGDWSDWGGKRAYGMDGPAINTAVASPDGSRLAFVSEASLTGYDNEQAEPGECEGAFAGIAKTGERETGRCHELFVYDAVTGSLVCASCNPSGARPVGPSSFWQVQESYQSDYSRRNLTEGGVLFFDSGDALVPHATDGQLNVYEYENGHVYAISDVSGGYESFFMDAGLGGRDVFFGSADQLLPQDRSNSIVVYDAREDGGFPVVVASEPCDNGDSCKPPPAPQPGVFGAPASATFAGNGNPTLASAVAVISKRKTAKKKTVAHRGRRKRAKASRACRRAGRKARRVACQREAAGRGGVVAKTGHASAERRAGR